jgi:hypothetical protein
MELIPGGVGTIVKLCGLYHWLFHRRPLDSLAPGSSSLNSFIE